MFTELDRFQITGRGTVLLINAPETREAYDNLVNSEIVVDGKSYFVRAVEKYSVMHYDHFAEARRTRVVAVLVKELTDMEKDDKLPS